MFASRNAVLLGLLPAIALMGGQASAAAGNTGTFVRCSWRAQDQGYGYMGRGRQVGAAKCGAPLGKGRLRGRFRDLATDPPTVSEVASFTLSFKTGSLRGSYRISGPLSSAPYPGTLRLFGGSGRFKHATGTLSISCIGPWTVVCHASGTLTGIGS